MTSIRLKCNLFFFGSLFLISYTNAQTTFERLYNFSQKQSGFKVAEVDSNNYLFLTYIADCSACAHLVVLIKVNEFGDTIRTETFNYGHETYSNYFIQSNNSFVVPIISKPTLEVITTTLKLDSTLNIVWTNTFSIPGWNISGKKVVETSDGGFLVFGNANAYSGNQVDLFTLKIDSSGNTLWYKIVNFNTSVSINSVIETSNSNLMFAGTKIISTGISNIFIYQTDSLGDSLLTKSFYINSYNEPLFFNKWRNRYIIGGKTSDTTIVNSDGFVLFLDTNLDSTSLHIFDIGLHELNWTATSDSLQFIVCGSASNQSLTQGNVYLLKFDTSCAFVSYKLINAPGAEINYTSISKTSDGGLIIGTTSYLGGGFGNPSALLIKTDINGELLSTFELTNNLHFLSPNPSTAKFHFNVNNDILEGVVYSIQGNRIYEFDGNEIDLTNFDDGIYFYEVKLTSGLFQKGKLIKISTN